MSYAYMYIDIVLKLQFNVYIVQRCFSKIKKKDQDIIHTVINTTFVYMCTGCRVMTRYVCCRVFKLLLWQQVLWRKFTKEDRAMQITNSTMYV